MKRTPEELREIKVEIPDELLKDVLTMGEVNFDEFIKYLIEHPNIMDEASGEERFHHSYMYGFVQGFKIAYALFMENKTEKKKDVAVSDFVSMMMNNKK